MLKILITNDDGIDSPAFRAMVAQMREVANCFAVAPMEVKSCCSHGVTNVGLIRIEQRAEQDWAVSGTPADCVRIAVRRLGLQPDWVLSGVNEGGNLGVDICYSGTVAGAREAAMLGFPSMAFSQYLRRDVPRDWQASARCALHAFEHFRSVHREQREFWNINLPLTVTDSIPPPMIECLADEHGIEFEYEPIPEDGEQSGLSSVTYRSNYQVRPRADGRDVALCFGGFITATKLRVFYS